MNTNRQFDMEFDNAIDYSVSWRDFSFSEHMCSMARKAATSIFRGDDEDEDPETEVEVTNSQTGNELLQTGNGCPYTKENHDTSSPLSIPKESSVAAQNSNMQLSDIAISAFSKMSIDTMASSVAASLMGSSMASSVPPAVEEVSEEGLPIITLEEVKNHFSLQDAWMVVYDRVYNVTSFLAEHPGGIYVMEEHLGFDATVAFRSAGHSTDAFTMLNEYLIGILPKNERIYENRIRW